MFIFIILFFLPFAQYSRVMIYGFCELKNLALGIWGLFSSHTEGGLGPTDTPYVKGQPRFRQGEDTICS